MANHPLKDWRKAHGLTQTDVGNAIGVTKASVSRYEKGRMPTSSALVMIFALTEGAVTPNDWLPKREVAS
nr:helix-turn-helix transcriptional regulator [uncultured Cohaesibacter sp.]